MGVSWIKLTTSMFDDEKIKIIESMPNADTILIIWVKLLTLCGKCNANGYIMLSESILYTEEMLATIFNRPLAAVRMALDVFLKFGMIENTDNGLLVCNWEKHQNIEGLDRIREQTRKRVARHREKQKAIPEGNVTCNATVTPGNATDIDIEEDIEVEEDKEVYTGQKKPSFHLTIFNYWNSKQIIQHRKLTQKAIGRINSKMEDYTPEEIMQAIDNYARVLDNPDKYYFTYRWQLWEFLDRGLEKMLDWNVVDQNYRKDKSKKAGVGSDYMKERLAKAKMLDEMEGPT